MRIENVIVRRVTINVGFYADGALGDPPDITVEYARVGHDDIFDLLSQEVKDEIFEALFVLRGETRL